MDMEMWLLHYYGSMLAKSHLGKFQSLLDNFSGLEGRTAASELTTYRFRQHMVDMLKAISFVNYENFSTLKYLRLSKCKQEGKSFKKENQLLMQLSNEFGVPASQAHSNSKCLSYTIFRLFVVWQHLSTQFILYIVVALTCTHNHNGDQDG
uniref:Uncharacterized protein n=1 Tax=Glossina austeni TaxID=7395 RepID=A0A1A9UGK5_GLOAU